MRRLPRPTGRHLIPLLAVLSGFMLFALSFAAPVAAAMWQDDDAPAETAPAETGPAEGEPAEAEASDDEPVEAAQANESNLVSFMIGGVLVIGGGWAYLNKKKRFPGTRFR